MQRARDVLGLPVVCLDSGERIGTVRDILCDKMWRTLGIVLEERSWFQPGTFIPFEMIQAVGEDCLTVQGKDTATSMESLAGLEVLGLFTGNNRLCGKTVLTERGESRGVVEDVYFSPNWDRLVGCELSEGWIADLTTGRKRLPLETQLIVGKDALIIPDPAGHRPERVQ